MWTIRTITLTKQDLQAEEIEVGYLSQYGELLKFSLSLTKPSEDIQERVVVDLPNECFKIQQNKITFDLETFPIKLLVGDQLIINLSISVELFLKIYSISLQEIAIYLTSPDSKERLLAQFRLRRSKEESIFWQQIDSLQSKLLSDEDN